MLLFIILVIYGMWYATMKYTLHGEIIVVPDVTGMHHTSARDTLTKHGLCIQISDSGYNRKLAPGKVLIQHPEAGCEVKRDRKIYVTINSAKGPTLTIPDIADNCDVYEAEIRLRAMGFKLGPKQYVKGEKDWVMGVKCQGRTVLAGEKVPADALVVLVVGNNSSHDDQWDEETHDADENSQEYTFEEETEW
ncbi:MAG: PASTA domain-containing protein [Bacteroidaceae bacterium]|nr:PASTA domain-containing protein [Bacteroidaceae bacterium]